MANKAEEMRNPSGSGGVLVRKKSSPGAGRDRMLEALDLGSCALGREDASAPNVDTVEITRRSMVECIRTAHRGQRSEARRRPSGASTENFTNDQSKLPGCEH